MTWRIVDSSGRVCVRCASPPEGLLVQPLPILAAAPVKLPWNKGPTCAPNTKAPAAGGDIMAGAPRAARRRQRILGKQRPRRLEQRGESDSARAVPVGARGNCPLRGRKKRRNRILGGRGETGRRCSRRKAGQLTRVRPDRAHR